MKFGIAMAAKIPIIATTIINSIKVKPCCPLTWFSMAAPLGVLGVSLQDMPGNQIHDSEGPVGVFPAGRTQQTPLSQSGPGIGGPTLRRVSNAPDIWDSTFHVGGSIAV